MKFRAAPLLGVACLLAVAAYPSGASAQCCVAYDYSDSSKNTTNIISTLSEKINAMQLAIIESLRLGTGQLSGNLKEQIGASSNMKNVEDDRRVVGNVEMARFNTIKGAASGASSCNTITAGLSTGGLRDNTTSLSRALTSQLTNWDIGSDSSLPSSRGTDIAILKRIERHCTTYANEDDVRSGLCQSVPNPTMTNASIDVSKSLFYRTDGSESQTLDSDHVAAAQTFLVNVIAPRPLGAMLPREATSAGGREKAADRHASAARLSIATNVVSDILSNRAPQQNQNLVSWATSTAGQISGYKGANFSNGVSWYDATEIQARNWYQNTNVQTAFSTQGYEQAIKDMAHMTAFSVYLQWETYKLLEKQNLMTASMLAIATEQARGSRTITSSQ